MYDEVELAKAVKIAKKWIDRSVGCFSGFVFGKETGFENPQMRDQLLDEFIESKVIEHDGKRHNWYIKIDNQLTEMDWVNSEVDSYPIKLPLGLNEKCIVSPGNIIVVAGEGNAGKTVFALNLIGMNLKSQGGLHEEISLFNSEMHPAELKGRLAGIKLPYDSWNGLKAYRRMRDFHQVIKPDQINVIDFLENTHDFANIGEEFSKIHEALGYGVAVVCMQKRRGNEFAVGGEGTTEKSRLAISLFFDGHMNYAKITKCKFPNELPHPQGMERDFMIEGGANILPRSEWEFVTKAQRETRTALSSREAMSKQRGFGG